MGRVCSAGKNRTGEGSALKLKPTISKSAASLKGNDRIARMKAARELYSNLSKQRIKNNTDTPPKLAIDACSSRCNVGLKSRAKEQRMELNMDRAKGPQSFSCRSGPSPLREVNFQPMSSSLEMIKNNGIRVPNNGRYTSLGGVRMLSHSNCASGVRSIAPRPSLLPLGINVFDANVSETDKMKVKEFLAARQNTGTTPIKTKIRFEGASDLLSARSARSVRFQLADTIEEQRESGGDEVAKGFSVRHEMEARHSTTFDGAVSQPDPRKKKTSNKRKSKQSSSSFGEVLSNAFGKENKPTSRRSSRRNSTLREEPSTSSVTKTAVMREPEPKQQSSDFEQSYTWLFNMDDQGWKRVEPIMLEELIELLLEKRRLLQHPVDVALHPDDSTASTSMLSLPEEIPENRKVLTNRLGFRRLPSVSSRSSNLELQANQEVLLINEAVMNRSSPTPTRLQRTSLRRRQKDPVALVLGGGSPFSPIRDSSVT